MKSYFVLFQTFPCKFQSVRSFLNRAHTVFPVKVRYKVSARITYDRHVQFFYQINNRMVTSEETAERVKVEEIRISSERAFESEEIVWNLFQNDQGAPDIIVCMDEVDTEAVYQAVIDYNRVGETQVIGYYKSPATLDAVRRGTMAMSLYIDTEQMGKYSVQAMMECIRDGRTNSFYSVDLQFVDSENVSGFMRRGR